MGGGFQYYSVTKHKKNLLYSALMCKIDVLVLMLKDVLPFLSQVKLGVGELFFCFFVGAMLCVHHTALSLLALCWWWQTVPEMLIHPLWLCVGFVSFITAEWQGGEQLKELRHPWGVYMSLSSAQACQHTVLPAAASSPFTHLQILLQPGSGTQANWSGLWLFACPHIP